MIRVFFLALRTRKSCSGFPLVIQKFWVVLSQLFNQRDFSEEPGDPGNFRVKFRLLFPIKYPPKQAEVLGDICRKKMESSVLFLCFVMKVTAFYIVNYLTILIIYLINYLTIYNLLIIQGNKTKNSRLTDHCNQQNEKNKPEMSPV